MTTLTTTNNTNSKPPERMKASAPNLVFDNPEAIEARDTLGWFEDNSQGFDATTGSIDFNPEINLDTKVPDGVKSSLFNPGEWTSIVSNSVNIVSKTADVAKNVVSEAGAAASSLFKDEIFFSTPTETTQRQADNQSPEQSKNNPETEQPALYNPNRVIEDAIAAGPIQVAQQDLEKAIGVAERQITDSDPATIGLNSSFRKKNILDAYHGMIIYKSDSENQENLKKSQSENSLGGVQGTYKVSGQGLNEKQSLNDRFSGETKSTAQQAVG